MADARSIYLQRLREKGYPEHLLGGINLNIGSESSGDPGAIGDDGAAFGLLQWNGPRKAALFDFAAQQGMNPADPVLQADFTDYENQTSENAAYTAALAAPDAGTAGAIWVNQWERPAPEHAARRTAEYTALGSNVVVPGSDGSVATTGAGTQVAAAGQPGAPGQPPQPELRPYRIHNTSAGGELYDFGAGTPLNLAQDPNAVGAQNVSALASLIAPNRQTRATNAQQMYEMLKGFS